MIPLGIAIGDDLILAVEGTWRGWVLHEVAGRWVGLRRATAEDVVVAKSLVLPVFYELAVHHSAGETT